MNPHSWEEEAFAEDARGPLGGFIWPPRSYSCSFCRRELRSAQALGGHMNVHRRDKAKLKQTVNSNGTTLTPPQNDTQESFFPSSIPSVGHESLDSSSDTKSCVYDDDLVVTDGTREAETNLVLGLFELDSCSNMGVRDSGGDTGGKRRRTDHVPPVIMQGGLDLELRLASFHAW